jgi:hypothetical protein
MLVNLICRMVCSRGAEDTWWDAGGNFACPDNGPFYPRCQNREGRPPVAIHTAAFGRVLVMLVADGFAMGRVLT